MTRPVHSMAPSTAATVPDRDRLPFGSTIYQRLHERLRDEILDGQLAPGARLKIGELGARFGLSHMPVREALQKLEGEGLVVVAPNRGASVRQVDAQLLEHVYDVIEALDSMLTAKAALHANDADLQRIRQSERAFAAAARRRDWRSCLACNDSLHKAIHAASGNAEAMRLIGTPEGLIRALRSRLGYGSERLGDIVAQHAAIVDAIEAQDSERARALAVEHIDAARKDLVERLARHEPSTRSTATGPPTAT